MPGISFFQKRAAAAGSGAVAPPPASTGEDDNTSVSSKVSFADGTKEANNDFAKELGSNFGFAGQPNTDLLGFLVDDNDDDEYEYSDTEGGFPSGDVDTPHTGLEMIANPTSDGDPENMSIHEDSGKTPAGDGGIGRFQNRRASQGDKTQSQKMKFPDETKLVAPNVSAQQNTGMKNPTNGFSHDSTDAGDVEMEIVNENEDETMEEEKVGTMGETVAEDDTATSPSKGGPREVTIRIPHDLDPASLDDQGSFNAKQVSAQDDRKSQDDNQDQSKMASIKNTTIATTQAKMTPQDPKGVSTHSHRPSNQAVQLSGTSEAHTNGGVIAGSVRNSVQAQGLQANLSNINRSSQQHPHSPNNTRLICPARSQPSGKPTNARMLQGSSRMTTSVQRSAPARGATINKNVRLNGNGIGSRNLTTKSTNRPAFGKPIQRTIFPTNGQTMPKGLGKNLSLTDSTQLEKPRASSDLTVDRFSSRTETSTVVIRTTTTSSRLAHSTSIDVKSSNRKPNPAATLKDAPVTRSPVVYNKSVREVVHNPPQQQSHTSVRRNTSERSAQVEDTRPKGNPLEDARRFEEMHRTGDIITRDFFDNMKAYRNDLMGGQISLAEALEALLEMDAMDVDTLAMAFEVEAKLDEYIETNDIDLPSM